MKRFIALLLALIMIVGTFTSCADSNFRFENDIEVSRGKWLKEMSESFGFTMYQQTEPYFSDIDKNHELFMYAQSAYEWEVVDTVGASFRPDDVASLEFVILTAVYAIDPRLDVAEGGDRFDAAMDYALQNGIAPQGVDYQADATPEQCEEILKSAQQAYLNKKNEPINEVTYAEDAVDMREQADSIEKIADGKYLVKGKKPAVGDVLIAPGTAQNPDGEAIKVVTVTDNGDGTYTITTSTPELYEVVDVVEFSGTVAPEADEIIPDAGVEIVSVTKATGIPTSNFETPQVDNLGKSGDVKFNQVNEIKGLSEDTPIRIEANANFKDGTVKISNNWNDKEETIDLFDKDGKMEDGLADEMKESGIIPDKSDMSEKAYKNSTPVIDSFDSKKDDIETVKAALDKDKALKPKDSSGSKTKYEAGYEITGSVVIDNLYVDLDYELETKKLFGVNTGIPKGIKELTIKTNYDVTHQLNIEGTFHGEVRLMQMPIPLGSVGSVNLEVFLVADINGEIEIKVMMGSNSKIEYKNGNFKQTTKKYYSQEASIKVTIKAGPQLVATLSILCIPIVDASVQASILIEGDAKIKYGTDYVDTGSQLNIERKTTLSYGIVGYIPLIDIGVGNKSSTLLNKLGLKHTWEVVKKEDAYKFDIVTPVEKVLWSDTKTLDYSPNAKDENNKVEGYSEVVGEQLAVAEYSIKLAPGESRTIQVEYPAGYSASDMIWTSTNNSIVTVSNGVVTGVSSGSVNITGVSKDKKYNVSCAVTVN